MYEVEMLSRGRLQILAPTGGDSSRYDDIERIEGALRDAGTPIRVSKTRDSSGRSRTHIIVIFLGKEIRA
jgi:hypothetical protein